MALVRSGPERSGRLAVFLVVAMLVEALRLVAGSLVACFSEGSAADLSTKAAIVAGAGTVGLFLAWQVWLWQRWAVYAWIVASLVSAVVALWNGIEWPIACGQLLLLIVFGFLLVPVVKQLPAVPVSGRKAARAERTCPGCNARLSADAKFCDVCGARLARRCSQCGAGNRDEARFCKQCGSSLFVGTALPGPE
jgi:hypothetical protein